VRCGLVFFAALSACACTAIAGAAGRPVVVARSAVTALAADGDQAAFAAARTSADCDRVFVWQLRTHRTFQLGKRQRCDTGSTGRGVAGVAVTGGRALWVNYVGGNYREWRLWTATTARPTPRQLQFVARDVDDPQPLIVGKASGGLLPYALDSTVTTLRANGATAFAWPASSPIIALAARDGRVAVAQAGARVTVLDDHGKTVSVDLYSTEVSAIAFVPKGLLVQRGPVLELRRGADMHEFAIAAGAKLEDANGKSVVWSADGLVHVMSLPDGAETAVYPGTHAALAGNRLYVATGRRITLRTIR